MIDYVDFQQYAVQCAPSVHHKTMAYLVRKESSFNPFAIGVVGGHLPRQPRNLNEAVATAKLLIERGINFSAGLTQVNRYNFARKNLDIVSVFDVCRNLTAGSEILSECFERAGKVKQAGDQQSIRFAFSCFYSGNFSTGFRDGYVQAIEGYIPQANSLPRRALAR